MRALVTGGAGFIGSHLANALIDQDWDVRVLDNFFTGRRECVPAGAEVMEGDVADSDTVGRAVDGVDVIFHQAAHRAVPRSINTPLSTNRANTHGTVCVLTAAQHAGIRRVVCASSSSIYGPTEVFPTPESEPLRPMSPYAANIAAATADGDGVAGKSYNLGGGVDLSVVELLTLVAQLLGTEPRAEHVASRATAAR